MKTIVKPALTLVTALLLLFSFVTFVGTARAASVASPNLLPGVISGWAYAGYLKAPTGVGTTGVGPLYLAALGCALSNKTTSASAVSMKLGSYAISGPVTDTAMTSRTSTSATAQASSSVQDVNILAGLITSNRVNAVANSHATATLASSTNSTNFVGLKIAGIPILFNPAPNTTIPLAGLGSVTLNEQSGPVDSADFTIITVTGIDINVTVSNVFKLPIGTHILVASAQTSFARTSILAATVADSYGLFAVGNAGSGFVTSGPWAPANIGCTGGNLTISLTSLNVPGVGNTGSMTDTASGQITSSGANANSSSTIRHMDLLNGTITAGLVISTAQASSNGTASATTTLSNAKVAGVPLPANPSPNTKIPISGLGFVVVNEQSITVTSTGVLAKVNVFDIHITTANPLGLPVGVDIIVGHSDALILTA